MVTAIGKSFFLTCSKKDRPDKNVWNNDAVLGRIPSSPIARNNRFPRLIESRGRKRAAVAFYLSGRSCLLWAHEMTTTVSQRLEFIFSWKVQQRDKEGKSRQTLEQKILAWIFGNKTAQQMRKFKLNERDIHYINFCKKRATQKSELVVRFFLWMRQLLFKIHGDVYFGHFIYLKFIFR